jgi:NTP pyrophosphatase (non-canonical NTP hydrolase)
MASIKDLQTEIKQFIDEREWNQFHNYKDLAISLSLESSEVLEHFQRKDAQKMQQHATDHKEDIAEELADVFYWILLLSNKLDIDLTEVFRKKMVQN